VSHSGGITDINVHLPYLLLTTGLALLQYFISVLSQQQTSVLSQQKTSVLSQQKTSVLSQQQTSATSAAAWLPATFAPLEQNRGSRPQTHENSLIFVKPKGGKPGGPRPPLRASNSGRSWELGKAVRAPQCKHCLGNF